MLSLASFFQIEAREYENFRITEETASTLTLFILALSIGIALAACFTLYQRYVPGSFIRALLKSEANSGENAKTASELGFENNVFIKFELRFGTVMLKCLRFTSENGTNDKYPDFSTARFYIPEELKYRAEARYDTKGNGPFQLILTIIFSVVAAVLIVKLLPFLLSLVDAIL